MADTRQTHGSPKPFGSSRKKSTGAYVARPVPTEPCKPCAQCNLDLLISKLLRYRRATTAVRSTSPCQDGPIAEALRGNMRRTQTYIASIPLDSIRGTKLAIARNVPPKRARPGAARNTAETLAANRFHVCCKGFEVPIETRSTSPHHEVLAARSTWVNASTIAVYFEERSKSAVYLPTSGTVGLPRYRCRAGVPTASRRRWGRSRRRRGGVQRY
jgi:hypothetical protein